MADRDEQGWPDLAVHDMIIVHHNIRASSEAGQISCSPELTCS